MYSKLQKIRDRGILLTSETLFNRIVPASIFRFSIGDVLELDLPRMCQNWKELPSADFSVTCVEDAEKRNELRRFTWNSVPLETTENDFGYSISRTGQTPPVLGGVWAGTESFIESNLGFRMELDHNLAWLYCAYVDENTRGLGVYTRLLSFVGSDLTARGFERLLVVIQPWNKASMHCHRRFTRNKVGRICVLRLFRLSFVFCTGGLAKNKTVTAQQLDAPVRLRIA